MKIPLPLAIVFALTATSSALSIVVRKPVQFAILNLPGTSYLQMEVDGFTIASAPHIDSVKVEYSGASEWSEETGLFRRVANLRVWWSEVPTGASSTTPHLTQITHAITDSASSKERGHAVRIDTIFHREKGWEAFTSSVGIPHVDNSKTGPRQLLLKAVLCAYEEPLERKARLLKEFASLWSTKKFHAVLKPIWITTLVYVSPWSRTDGSEDVPGIVAPMPGNRGNWIDIGSQTFSSSTIADIAATKQIATESVISLGFYTLPTGFARYVYNRTNDPDTKILEPEGPRHIDGVYKIGPTLEVSGSTRDVSDGNLPGVDSLMSTASWLVLADSTDTPSVERAMWPTRGFCKDRQRASAWKIEGTTVWLDQTTTIELPELLATLSTTSVDRKDLRGATALARITKRPGGLEVNLVLPATVRVSTLSGRVLREGRTMDAGSHRIDLGDTHGMLVVQATRADRTETHTIVR